MSWATYLCITFWLSVQILFDTSQADLTTFDIDEYLKKGSAQGPIPFSRQAECADAPPDEDGLPKLTVTDETAKLAPGYGLWGDMLLPLDYFQNDSKKGSGPPVDNVISNTNARWTGRTVPYVIHASLESSRSLIERAFNEYHQKTCVRFVPRTRQHSNYIHIFFGEGCYSMIGMTGQGGQPISLGQGCLFYGTVVHELGHALGFFHEQNREDRDDHITVYWSNIQQAYQSQFSKVTPADEILYTEYDLDSIMHYGERSFSRDGVSTTMRAKNGKRLSEPYDKHGLSPSDVREVRLAYGC